MMVLVTVHPCYDGKGVPKVGNLSSGPLEKEEGGVDMDNEQAVRWGTPALMNAAFRLKWTSYIKKDRSPDDKR